MLAGAYGQLPGLQQLRGHGGGAEAGDLRGGAQSVVCGGGQADRAPCNAPRSEDPTEDPPHLAADIGPLQDEQGFI